MSSFSVIVECAPQSINGKQVGQVKNNAAKSGKARNKKPTRATKKKGRRRDGEGGGDEDGLDGLDGLDGEDEEGEDDGGKKIFEDLLGC
jgi:hypothetical protein